MLFNLSTIFTKTLLSNERKLRDDELLYINKTLTNEVVIDLQRIFNNVNRAKIHHLPGLINEINKLINPTEEEKEKALKLILFIIYSLVDCGILCLNEDDDEIEEVIKASLFLLNHKFTLGKKEKSCCVIC